MDYAYAKKGPVYLRMGKSDRGDVHGGPLGRLEAGTLLQVRSGRTDRPGLIATGSMVSTALKIGRVLDLAVWSAPVLKPLRVDHVCAAARVTFGLVTLEEHSVLGGLGAAVAEITGEHEPVRVLRIGVPDRFSEHCGTYSYLLREHGLDTESVRERISAFCQSTVLRFHPGSQS
jgi:transketolase